MAKEKKISYPAIPLRAWWELRERFKKALPSTVTLSYLATALGMSESSAQTNVMPSLKSFGLVDGKGKPTDLAVRWRDDAQYGDVCQELIKAVYPQELQDLAPDFESLDRSAIEQWFQNKEKVGRAAAARYVTIFLTLLEANPKKRTAGPKRTAKGATVGSQSPKAPKVAKVAKKRADKHLTDPPGGGFSPTLNLNIQIHISPESTTEQIDQIFASMAKHLSKE